MSDNRRVAGIIKYPVKSTRGNALKRGLITQYGLDNDRTVAIIDADNKIVTGRDYPKLLHIESSIDKSHLKLAISSDTYSFPLPSTQDEFIEIKLFRTTVSGILFNKDASNLVSKLLEGNFRLVHLGTYFRPLSPKRGGKDGEFTAYADSAPVHLINLRTLDYLNSKLSNSVSIQNFRPNIIIAGFEAFEEDTWDIIEINECKFRVQEKTQRCVFTTIDPETLDKDEELEPLATIAKTRSAKGLRPSFGINLVPITEGFIELGDSLKVIKTAVQ